MMEVETCAGPVTGRSLSSGHSNRRITKSAMEKKRRARINTCLTELKAMLSGMIAEKTEKFDKLEKADILELTVKYVKQLQRSSAKEDMSTPDDKYRRGFNTCFNEVLKYISASDSCKPEMRAKVLSHLVDRFSNQDASNTDQSQQYLEKSTSQNTISVNQSEFLTEKLANRIQSSTDQPCSDTVLGDVAVPAENGKAAFILQDSNIVNCQKYSSPIFDQNNNVKHNPVIQNGNAFGYGSEQSNTMRKSPSQKENMTHLGHNSGLIKIANPNQTMQLQLVNSCVNSSDATRLAGCVGVQTTTASPLNGFNPNDILLSTLPVLSPVNDSSSIMFSVQSAAAMTQTPMRYATPLKLDPIQLNNHVNGQLTVLVPANMITMPTISPNGPATVLLACGSRNSSPVGSVAESSYQMNEKFVSDNADKIGRIDIDTNIHNAVQTDIDDQTSRQTDIDPIHYNTRRVAADTAFRTHSSVGYSGKRSRPYEIPSYRHMDSSAEQLKLSDSLNNTNLVSLSVDKRVNSHNNTNSQVVSPPLVNFQLDGLESKNYLNECRKSEFDSVFDSVIESPMHMPSSVWRPWSM